MITIEINNKQYIVEEAKTKEEKSKGLSNRESLDDNSGMLFYFDKPQTVSFWMKDTLIPLDIIFIDEDEEVISVKKGNPKDTTSLIEDNVKYVLELNQDSGVKVGNELEFIDDEEDSEYVMQVLAPDGTSQMNLKGGERIVSRKETKIIIKKAKKAKELESDQNRYEKLCKQLGKYMFKVLKGQDTRKPEYVSVNKN